MLLNFVIKRQTACAGLNWAFMNFYMTADVLSLLKRGCCDVSLTPGPGQTYLPLYLCMIAVWVCHGTTGQRSWM